MRRARPKNIALRRGMTLVELLAVITILVILIVVAVPAMKPALKDRKLREAARMINTQIAIAKSQAVEKNRPIGIWITTNPNVPNTAYQIFIAETPIPFAGDSIGATAQLTATSGFSAGYANQATFSDIQNLVAVGDLIQFDLKGPFYRITAAGNTPKTVTFAPMPGQMVPYPRLRGTDVNYPTHVQFQVIRQPVRSSAPPLELPNGIVIDLSNSGIGYSGTEFSGMVDPRIMFTPSGGVASVIPLPSNAVPGTIHLHIGRVEQSASLESDVTKLNLRDPTTLWVSIGHQTGTVTTSENRVDPSDTTPTMAEYRAIAQAKQTMGGR
jgi:prepilin-type N-terminal cleavage/methylation domain-containing protein